MLTRLFALSHGLYRRVLNGSNDCVRRCTSQKLSELPSSLRSPLEDMLGSALQHGMMAATEDTADREKHRLIRKRTQETNKLNHTNPSSNIPDKDLRSQQRKGAARADNSVGVRLLCSIKHVPLKWLLHLHRTEQWTWEVAWALGN